MCHGGNPDTHFPMFSNDRIIMIIKVCGMRDGNNIREVAALGVDWIGMIFCPESPRYVWMMPTGAGIIPDRGTLDEQCTETSFKRVGVFVDDMPQNIITRAVNYKLDLIQLHGNEPATLIRNLRATLDPDIRSGIRFIKAISINKAEDIDRFHEYEDCVDYFLFDTRCAGKAGGSGTQFDWSLLEHYNGRKPFLLSGGIGPDDADKIKKMSHPQFAGIDLNSRFEIQPGVKDVEALRGFINKIR